MSYEHKDVSLKVVGISAGLLAFMVAASIGTATCYYYAKYHPGAGIPTAGRAGSFTHGPDEQIGILKDYADVTKTSEDHLHGYGWVDEKAGLAHIPIDRAMELIASGAKPAPGPKEPGQVP